jgi:hypothetical protein
MPGRAAAGADEVGPLVPLSDLVHFDVFDESGQRASLRDFVVDIGTEYPLVTRLLVVDRRGSRQVAASGLELSLLSREVRIDRLTTGTSEGTRDAGPDALLVHALLDKLIIDLGSRGPARVNDIFLNSSDDGLRLRAIDTSPPWSTPPTDARTMAGLPRR